MSSPLLIFAKAPVPGYAKTRLIPALGEQGAATLQQRMINHVVEEARLSGVGPVTLYCAPDSYHPLFQQLQQDHGLGICRQQGADIGERMLHGFEQTLKESEMAILVGTDCPQLDAKQFQAVHAALQGSEAVVIPALDGGYVLIALRRAFLDHLPTLFRGIEWGSDQVMEATRMVLDRSGLEWAELSPLSDIDIEEDLALLPPQWGVSNPCGLCS
ncbi:MAG: TIGR04282 family arsenosugar biosynthesis glycosyltransferase [Gammaproteobacteria bacterium]|uniref:TIGR04282 family arsenosugar biosynthesis glycosyltransferase n=1 Tax=Candidatus Thiopontia autotrophica TaxID=2841688 RepID=A0A8J6TSR7_9GAMM|nr:TIGR04282 family arsenosugar biosynthesis glycosyltransferase [Candidatus Thiopontia autotrophica]MBL6969597.1 TIGR04282 family arsenosugar biosynthesis glycosyltransferase [Gammaproteobacteria bacterium]